MAHPAPSSSLMAPEPGYRVELPRQCDAIGTVLRDAFSHELGLPDDMVLLLRRMNRGPAPGMTR